MRTAKVRVEVSARHIHLSKEDYLLLFASNPDYKITKKLSQIGEFATDKKVKIFGPDGQVEVRFLGPFRQQTQVELSMTDCINLGIKPPYDCEVKNNAAKIQIVGDSGEICRKAAIISHRHLHCSPSEAKKNGLKNQQKIAALIKTDRGAIKFFDIIVRISDHYRLSIHLDTDEGNAAGIINETFAELEF